eukprot:17798-Heterococcus_DN1.PRE.1
MQRAHWCTAPSSSNCPNTITVWVAAKKSYCHISSCLSLTSMIPCATLAYLQPITALQQYSATDYKYTSTALAQCCYTTAATALHCVKERFRERCSHLHVCTAHKHQCSQFGALLKYAAIAVCDRHWQAAVTLCIASYIEAAVSDVRVARATWLLFSDDFSAGERQSSFSCEDTAACSVYSSCMTGQAAIPCSLITARAHSAAVVAVLLTLAAQSSLMYAHTAYYHQC